MNELDYLGRSFVCIPGHQCWIVISDERGSWGYDTHFYYLNFNKKKELNEIIKCLFET